MADSYRSQRAQETRRAILHAATMIFARRGYDDASIDDIAAEAGLSKGAIYHHFESKEEILHAVLRNAEGPRREVTEAIAGAQSFSAVMDRLLTLWLDHYTPSHPMGTFLFETIARATRDPVVRKLLGASFQETQALFSTILTASVEARLIEPSVDPQSTAAMIMAVFYGLALQTHLAPTQNVAALRPLLTRVLQQLAPPQPDGDFAHFRKMMTQLTDNTLRQEPSSNSRRPKQL